MDESPFYLNTNPCPRDHDEGQPSRAAENALGVGGTNVHVILEEPPHRSSIIDAAFAQPCYLLPISAKDATALNAVREALVGYLERPETPPLADIAATLQVGRKHFGSRAYVVAGNKAEAASKLRALAQPLETPGSETCHAEVLARQWVRGATDKLKPEGNSWRRVSLPGYPFRSAPYYWKS